MQFKNFLYEVLISRGTRPLSDDELDEVLDFILACKHCFKLVIALLMHNCILNVPIDLTNIDFELLASFLGIVQEFVRFKEFKCIG